MDYSSLTLIRRSMWCKKVQNMMSWKERRSNSRNNSRQRLRDMRNRINPNFRGWLKIIRERSGLWGRRKMMWEGRYKDCKSNTKKLWDRSRKKKMMSSEKYKTSSPSKFKISLRHHYVPRATYQSQRKKSKKRSNKRRTIHSKNVKTENKSRDYRKQTRSYKEKYSTNH